MLQQKVDNNKPQRLVDYFIEVQKRNIEKALNIKDVTSTSLDEVTNIFSRKISQWNKSQYEAKVRTLAENRLIIFNY